MSVQAQPIRPPEDGRIGSPIGEGSIWQTLLQYVVIATFNAMALIIIYAFLNDDNLGLAFVFIVMTILANVVVFVPHLSPIRWIAPGIIMMILFVVYPVVYTVATAFTNYGDNHMLTKAQTIDLIERRQFVPEGGQAYTWDLYQSNTGDYALWLAGTDEAGNSVIAFAPVGTAIEDVNEEFDAPPPTYRDFRLLSAAERAQAVTSLQGVVFGIGEDTAAIAGRRQAARPLVQQYVYDSYTDSILDRATNTLYRADNDAGLFVKEGDTSGEVLSPGFRATIGLANFSKLYEQRDLLGPLIEVFVWTVAFSALGTITCFAFGLLIALILDYPGIPFPKLWRSLIFIPYAIPSVISVLVWKGLLNQNLGLVTNAINDLVGVRIPWFTDAGWAKVAILLVNLWLGYPYMMLVCSGALKAIPSSMYEAAAVDGARPWQAFSRITLPMLLVAIGPMLIASFAYGFNNYLLIEVLTEGNPPIPGTSTPAGYTDLLINYTYNLAFGSSKGADYGYASAITIAIFIVLTLITIFNYRFVSKWEEVGENV